MAKAERFNGSIILCLSDEEAAELCYISGSHLSSNIAPVYYQALKNVVDKDIPDPFTGINGSLRRRDA
jgi:hypothetical protein